MDEMDDLSKKISGEEYPLNVDRPDFQPPDPESLEGDIPAAQEASFLNMRTLLIAVIGLVGMIVFVHLLGAILFGYFSFLNPFGAAPPPASLPGTVVPPGPQLQVVPGQDLEQVRENERANLEGFGWVDPQNRVVRIPIERAMELLAQRGLPVSEREVEPGVSEADNSGFGFSPTEQP